MRCPCRKKSETIAYDQCCAPFHQGARLPPTAEALMRSRYAAYALQNVEYLLATWHPSTRPADLSCDPVEWILLRILAARQEGDSATVEFVARSRVDGRVHDLHEVSRFVRQDGRWFYLSAETD